MFRLTRSILFFVLLWLLSVSFAHADNNYLAELIDAANHKQLAAHDQWLSLLHYNENTYSSGYTSSVVTRSFFNAEDGRSNPQAELEATLKAFFSQAVETDKTQNPQCRFIARYHWLDKHLKFDKRRLPRQVCNRFNQWYKTINPDQVTMVFPAGTDNSPSSMFGHTLVRIDQKNQDERTRLFSYAINFAAETDETNGIIFAFKGIFGGYPGRFSIMPYYEKVNQYNQMENRDVWEYQLNFSPAEIDILLQHAWELGQVDFEYYFFLENCSYRLLELFDVARPGHNLADEFNWFAIPGDTVRVALQEQGFLKQTIYRPSERTRIKHYVENLSASDHELVKQLVNGEIVPTDALIQQKPAAQQSLMLDTSYSLLQYKLNSNDIERDQAAKRSYGILLALNKLEPHNSPAPTVPSVRLDEGHKTSRVAVGYVHRDQEDYMSLQFRPAYHDLLDLNEGYTKNAQINFFDIKLEQSFTHNTTRLNEFTLIDILSLTPRDEFFTPISWKFRTGFERLPIDQQGYDRLVYTINGGAGPTFSITEDLSFFMLAEASILFHNDLKDNYALGAGINTGFYWAPSRYARTWLNARSQRYSDHLDLSYIEYNLEQSFTLTTDSAIRFKYSEHGPRSNRSHEVSANLHWYF